MLPKKKRLTKDLFEVIMKTGRSIHSQLFSFRSISRPDLDTKYAFVVPKSVSKKAVERNKLRRQGYAALKSIPGMDNLKINGIFFYKKTQARPTYQEIKKNIEAICEKLS